LTQGWDSSGGGNWSGLYGHNGDYWGFGHAQAFAFPGGGSRWVEAGTVIAWTGTTGGSTGPHNHIAFRPRGSNVYRDPHDILVAAANQAPEGSPPPQVPEVAPEEDEDDDMNPRPHFVTPVGEHWWISTTGKLTYITGLGALSVLEDQKLLDAPQAVDAATWEQMKPSVNG
jgi:murein DD-endopeptidase MepM/ murein hydrolase activator NlpD